MSKTNLTGHDLHKRANEARARILAKDHTKHIDAAADTAPFSALDPMAAATRAAELSVEYADEVGRALGLENAADACMAAMGLIIGRLLRSGVPRDQLQDALIQMVNMAPANEAEARASIEKHFKR